MRRTELLSDCTSFTITTTCPTDDLKYLFNKIRNSDAHRSANYTLDKVGNAYAFSVTYFNNEPALCSVAWERPYYHGSVRLMTSYGVRPDLQAINFGKGIDNYMRIDVTDHINQQLEICKLLGRGLCFISQVGRAGGRRIRAIASTVNKYTPCNWNVSDKPILVAPDPSNPECWQYVISNHDLNLESTMAPALAA